MRFKTFLTEGPSMLDQMKTWLRELGLSTYAYNKTVASLYFNGDSIDANDSISLAGHNITRTKYSRIPVPFGKIEGAFYVLDQRLTTLENMPKSVHGVFNCSQNDLTSFEHGPEEVGGFFSVSNPISSLVNSPHTVYDAYHVRGWKNCFTSLRGFPSYVGGDVIIECDTLTSLIGMPQKMHARVSLVGNFSSLEGITPYYDDDQLLLLSSENLTSLNNVHKHIKQLTHLNLDNSPVASSILGLLLIKNLINVSTRYDGPLRDVLETYINKRLPNTTGMESVSRCQDELEEAGYGDFAEL